ncbi:MAG: regulatory protein RecX [Gammaproteobacteria bacterium]|nr:regulatory protein RecX [Gammaproteobacteria bacterium]
MTDAADGPTLAEVRDAAIRLLARREHSRRELGVKLAGRGVSSGLVETALDELADQGLQSDIRYAESYARQRCERGYGPHRLRAELRERGVADGLIASALNALEVDWFERATQVRAKRFGAGQPEDFRAAARQRQFLEYRGFPGDIVREVVAG